MESLTKNPSEKFGAILENGPFCVGRAQKALNVYLKSLWCLGRISDPPPHYPFDRRILVDVLKLKDTKWTAMNDVEEYQRWVSKARAAANGLSPAEWELREWSRADGRPEP